MKLLKGPGGTKVNLGLREVTEMSTMLLLQELEFLSIVLLLRLSLQKK